MASVLFTSLLLIIMKKRPLITVHLIVISVLFILLATSCKKDDDTTVTDIDGDVYDVVQIGTQLWLKQNLKTTKFNDGSSIPLVTDNSTWSNLTSPGYCWYNNDEATYKNDYGALYNWYSVNTGKLCPAGWHVPSDTEWTTLTSYLGGEAVAGGKLKETGTTHWISHNSEVTNESGFTGLPGGCVDSNGSFGDIGVDGYWWSNLDLSTDDAWHRVLGYNFSNVVRTNSSKDNGFSIRCLKD